MILENNLNTSFLILNSMNYFCIKNNFNLIYSKDSAIIAITDNENNYLNNDFYKNYEPLTQFNNIDILTHESMFDFNSGNYLKSLILNLNLFKKQKLLLHLLNDNSLSNLKFDFNILFQNLSVKFYFPSKFNGNDNDDFKILNHLKLDSVLYKLSTVNEFDELYEILKNKNENYLLKFLNLFDFYIPIISEKSKENIIFNILKLPLSPLGIKTLSQKFPLLLDYYENNNSHTLVENVVKIHFNFNEIFKNSEFDYYFIESVFKFFKSNEMLNNFRNFNINIENFVITDHYVDFFILNYSNIESKNIQKIILNIFTLVNNDTILSDDFKFKVEKQIFNDLLNASTKNNNIINKNKLKI